VHRGERPDADVERADTVRAAAAPALSAHEHEFVGRQGD
jgi:carbamate kinase